MPKRKRIRREQGYIEQRGLNKYLVRWRENGKQPSKIVRGDYAAALKFLADKLDPPQIVIPKPERTFHDYADHEWAQYVRDHWKASTQITQGSFVRARIVP